MWCIRVAHVLAAPNLVRVATILERKHFLVLARNGDRGSRGRGGGFAHDSEGGQRTEMCA